MGVSDLTIKLAAFKISESLLNAALLFCVLFSLVDEFDYKLYMILFSVQPNYTDHSVIYKTYSNTHVRL